MGVSGGASVDRDLRAEGRERTELVALALALGVLSSIMGVLKTSVDVAACLRKLPDPSSTADSSSGSSSTVSRMGGTVPTTLLGCSIELASLLCSGESSSGSPSSSRACASLEPRFLFPSCGVANAFGVACRLPPLLRCTDALRCRFADLVAVCGVCCFGVGVR